MFVAKGISLLSNMSLTPKVEDELIREEAVLEEAAKKPRKLWSWLR